MGIDGGHGGAHDFKSASRVTLLEKCLQISPHTKSGFGIPQCRGLAQQEYPVRSRRFMRAYPHRGGAPRDFRRKKPPAKLFIFHEIVLIADANLVEEGRGIAVPSQAQPPFQNAEQEERKPDCRYDAKERTPTRVELNRWIRGSRPGRVQAWSWNLRRFQIPDGRAHTGTLSFGVCRLGDSGRGVFAAVLQLLNPIRRAQERKFESGAPTRQKA